MAGVGLSRLILVGGGPAHLFVLEALARRRLAPSETLLIAPEARQLHAAMLPGFLTGRFTLEEVSLDLARLAAGVGARFVAATVTRLDAAAREITLSDGTTESYDLASLAIGGQPASLGLPGVGAHALTVRPASRGPEIEAALLRAAQAAGPEPLQVAIVGGGPVGVEVALAVRTRLDLLEASRAVISLFETSHTVVRSGGLAVAEKAEAALREREITLRLSTRVEGVGPGHLVVDGGRVVAADLILWAPGIEAQPLYRESGLPTDARGFLSVDDALTVPGCPGLFGAGEGVGLITAPRLPHSSAVELQQSPVLARNLAAAVAGEGRFRNYKPKEEVLSLLDTGDGRALGFWRGLAVHNAAALALKDRIDRRFVRRFQKLGGGTGAAASP